MTQPMHTLKLNSVRSHVKQTCIENLCIHNGIRIGSVLRYANALDMKNDRHDELGAFVLFSLYVFVFIDAVGGRC